MVTHRMQIASIPQKGYKEVIEIRVPVRFYWDETNTFDGLEVGEFADGLQDWEKVLLEKCLRAIMPAIGIKEGETVRKE